jgi:hypothetical protein
MTRNKSGALLLTMQRFTIITGPLEATDCLRLSGVSRGEPNNRRRSERRRQRYIDWAKDKELARNEDARFVSWVGSFTKGKASP